MKNIKIVVCLLLVLPFKSLAQTVLSLEQVLNEVSSKNPTLSAYQSRVASQEALIAGANAWMPPMLGAGTFMSPYPGANVMDESDRGAWMFSAEQSIPNASKIRAEKELLQSGISAIEANKSFASNQLRARAKQIYYDLLLARKKINYQQKNLMIMQTMKKLAEIRYPYNQGSLGQVFKSEGRMYEAENMIQMTQAEIQSKQIALNVLMNRAPNTSFEVDTSHVVEFVPLAELDTSYLADKRSDIMGMSQNIAVMGKSINTVQNSLKPTFSVRFEHMANRSSMMPNQFNLMGMIAIPIAPWSRGMQRSEIQSMEFEREAMRLDRDAMLIEALGMTKSMEAEILNMQKQLGNYQQKILPALTKNLDVTLLSYQENKESLNMVIDAWEALNMTQMTYLDQLSKFYQMITEYEKNIER